MSTKLIYMEDMQALACDSYVDGVDYRDGKAIIYLDQTVFYPQGGGQPYDTGTIETDDTSFIVEEVRYSDGLVAHIGQFSGRPMISGEDAKCKVNGERRALNTRLHSGGHVLDMAVHELNYNWKPIKGHHFPDGPYVEYSGDLEGDSSVDSIVKSLNSKITEIIDRNIDTEIKFMNKEEMARYCRHVPENIPEGKPGRIVMYGGFGVPCGGTHVANLKDIGSELIRKIKYRPGIIKISYEISPSI